MTNECHPASTSAVGDIFHGDYVDEYESRRAKKPQWQMENSALVSLLNGLPAGSSVLDLPFGTGRFLPEYAARDMVVTGSDISADIIDEGRRLRPELMKSCSIHIGPSVPLPFRDDAFDLVVSFRFLSGRVDSGTALATLKEFSRVAPRAILQLKCRPDGMQPAAPPQPSQKLSKNYFRRDMDDLFASCGWRIERDVQIDADPTGYRWAFLCIRL